MLRFSFLSGAALAAGALVLSGCTSTTGNAATQAR